MKKNYLESGLSLSDRESLHGEYRPIFKPEILESKTCSEVAIKIENNVTAPCCDGGSLVNRSSSDVVRPCKLLTSIENTQISNLEI